MFNKTSIELFLEATDAMRDLNEAFVKMGYSHPESDSGHLISELPITFKKEMVEANMENRKSQTRQTRTLKEMMSTALLIKHY